MKNSAEDRANGMMYFFSSSYRPGGHDLQQRQGKIIEQLLGEAVTGEKADQDGQETTHEALAQLPEVLQQGHGPFFFRLFFLPGRRIDGGRRLTASGGRGQCFLVRPSRRRALGDFGQPRRSVGIGGGRRFRIPGNGFLNRRNRFDGVFFNHGRGFNGGFVRLLRTGDARSVYRPGLVLGLHNRGIQQDFLFLRRAGGRDGGLVFAFCHA